MDGVFDFLNKRENYDPKYKVFKEYFVMCWAGLKKYVKDETFYSRVDIELVNEQVRLFFSNLDEVSIDYNEESFKIIEYVNLGLHNHDKYFQLEETIIKFGNNANYSINTMLLFDPPKYDRKALFHIYNANNVILDKLAKGVPLTKNQEVDLKNLPVTYLICHFNDFVEAVDKLTKAKPLLKSYSQEVYQLYKEAIRVLRKVKYS